MLFLKLILFQDFPGEEWGFLVRNKNEICLLFYLFIYISKQSYRKNHTVDKTQK